MKGNMELHYRYFIAIFLVIATVLATVKWYDIPKVAELLSFGLSLSSLVLAVVAIFQAFLAGAQNQQISHSMAQSVEKMRSAAESVENAASGLANQTRDLPAHLTGLSNRIDEVQRKWPTSTQDKISPAEGEILQKEKDILSKEEAERFIKQAPMGGVLSYYICAKSKFLDIPFKITDMGLDNNTQTIFIEGYITSLKSTKFFDIIFDKKRQKFLGWEFYLQRT